MRVFAFTNEKTPSFYVLPEKGIFKCFSSDKGGSVVTFLMELDKLSFPQAIKQLAERYGIEIEEEEIMARQPKLPTKRVCGLGIAGALVALYALHVERAMADPFYEPMCVTRWGSCAAVFSSAYAHPLSNWGLVAAGSDLDFSLAFLGILNYGVFALFPVWPLQRAAAAKVLLAISIASCLFSVYLLYVLKVLLDDFCVVCTTFHVINFSTLVFGAVPAYRATAAKPAKGE